MFRRKKPRWEILQPSRLTDEHIDFIRAYGERHIRQETFDTYRRIVDRGLRRMLIIFEARLDGNLLGFAVAYLPEHGIPCECAIHVVHPHHRSKGIGSALFANLVAAVERAGCQPHAIVHTTNIPSQRAIRKSLRRRGIEDGVIVYASH